MRVQPIACLSLLLACGAPARAPDATVLDAGDSPDVGVGDAGADDGGPTDAGADGLDGAIRDGALLDAGDRDAGPTSDAGPVTCTADSCGAAACGRSACGYPCGSCPRGGYCTREGRCAMGTPPGTLCVDAFGEPVAEGSRGFRTCPTDPSLLQACLCSGGGRDAWVGCGECEHVRVDGPRGAGCATDAQCGGGVPCHPIIRLCGEPCEARGPDVCPTGTACGVPGDIAGVCLPSCTTCGASCSAWQTCDGTVCVPSDRAWPWEC